jgi:ribosomal protein L16/L10AE
VAREALGLGKNKLPIPCHIVIEKAPN